MKRMLGILTIVLITVFVFSGCAPKEAPPTATEVPPAPTEAPPTEAPATEAPTTTVPTEEPVCLTVGATYGGPINDAGYNQAMHEAVVAIKDNIPCVSIIEAENVYDEAGATTTIENMISEGAKMIFATAYAHQYPALTLSQKYPDVIFEHVGGWEM